MSFCLPSFTPLSPQPITFGIFISRVVEAARSNVKPRATNYEATQPDMVLLSQARADGTLTDGTGMRSPNANTHTHTPQPTHPDILSLCANPKKETLQKGVWGRNQLRFPPYPQEGERGHLLTLPTPCWMSRKPRCAGYTGLGPYSNHRLPLRQDSHHCFARPNRKARALLKLQQEGSPLHSRHSNSRDLHKRGLKSQSHRNDSVAKRTRKCPHNSRKATCGSIRKTSQDLGGGGQPKREYPSFIPSSQRAMGHRTRSHS